MEKKKYNSYLLLIVMLCAMVMATASCGSDEPELKVAYYMEINSQVRLSLYEEDESQGTSANPDEDVLSNTILKMRTAMNDAYPEMTFKGDDARVITAIDNIYKNYKSMYGHLERNTVCTVKLIRVKMDGTHIVKSKTIKVYLFGALPQNTDEQTL